MSLSCSDPFSVCFVAKTASSPYLLDLNISYFGAICWSHDRNDSVAVQHVNDCFALFLSGLQGELRAEEEKGKEKDQERRDLEETVDVLRKELNKTEQARKDVSIKVKGFIVEIQQTHKAAFSVSLYIQNITTKTCKFTASVQT